MKQSKLKSLDTGQLEMMWNFLRFGRGKLDIADINELQYHLDIIREFMVIKTGSVKPLTVYKTFKEYSERTEYSYDDLGTIVNIIVCTAMRIYLDGGLDILRDYLNEHDLLRSDDCGEESERHIQT